MRFNELLENVKNQLLDVFRKWTGLSEEFFNRLNEWSYENMGSPLGKRFGNARLWCRSMRFDGLTTKTI